jgi:serine/threonine protein kinase
LFVVLIFPQVAVKSIKVRDDDEGSIKAAKKVSPRNSNNISTLIPWHQIILAEVQGWMSLRHENLLPVYGTTTGFGSSLPCLVSPWMENGSLASYLRTMSQTLTGTAKFSIVRFSERKT